MAHLSRIWLNPMRSGAQQLLRNPQAMHATVLSGLSRQPVTERVLWRMEPDTPHRIGVLVLTESTPSWEHLVEQAGWMNSDEPTAMTRPYEPLLDRVVRGREFRFRLKANPVVATRKPDKLTPAQQRRVDDGKATRGFRLAHRTSTYQLGWLTDRLPRWGFSPLDAEAPAQLIARERLAFKKKSGHVVVLHTATFQGHVRVDDPDTARRSLLDGVGSGKAYGCGLITLAPPTGRP